MELERVMRKVGEGGRRKQLQKLTTKGVKGEKMQKEVKDQRE